MKKTPVNRVHPVISTLREKTEEPGGGFVTHLSCQTAGTVETAAAFQRKGIPIEQVGSILIK